MGKSDHERKGRGVIEKANECHHLIFFWGGEGGQMLTDKKFEDITIYSCQSSFFYSSDYNIILIFITSPLSQRFQSKNSVH